jgi:hypothetical protein
MSSALRRGAVAVLVMALAFPASAQPPDECSGRFTNDLRTTDADDFLTGTEGPDVAALGLGNDAYFAFEEQDVICGGPGDDLIGGESNADELQGGGGNDILLGHGGADVLVGGVGADELHGASGDDVLRSTAIDEERDEIWDGRGSDVILGEPEDVWHRCDDEEPDPHDNFTGLIVPDTECA